MYDPYNGRFIVGPSGVVIDTWLAWVDACVAAPRVDCGTARVHSDARQLVPTSKDALGDKGDKGPRVAAAPRGSSGATSPRPTSR